MKITFVLSTAASMLLVSCAEPVPPSSQEQADLENMMAADAVAQVDTSSPEGSTGEPIEVTSDPRATYQLLQSSNLPNGNLEVLTRREGPSGVSFARREIDCGDMTFRYLGEGDTVGEAKQDSPNIGAMSEAMSTSISGEVARSVCTKS